MRVLSDSRLGLSPSDLNNFLACGHLTALDLLRTGGEITLTKAPRPDAELIAERGRQHEAAFLATLMDEGRDVVTIAPLENGSSTSDRTRATE
jgi:antitoxin (DNA-binding transcriptional repressor) of toxin-antitoxin stability system